MKYDNHVRGVQVFLYPLIFDGGISAFLFDMLHSWFPFEGGLVEVRLGATRRLPEQYGTRFSTFSAQKFVTFLTPSSAIQLECILQTDAACTKCRRLSSCFTAFELQKVRHGQGEQGWYCKCELIYFTFYVKYMLTNRRAKAE